MKATDKFKSVIENYLNETAQSDSVFAQSFSKATKNLESCFNYIFGEVKKTGFCAFDYQEIFDMAVTYYIDDTIGVPVPVQCKVEVKKPAENDLFSPPADFPQGTPVVQHTAVSESTAVKQDTAERQSSDSMQYTAVPKTEVSLVKSDTKTAVTVRKEQSKTLTLFDL